VVGIGLRFPGGAVDAESFWEVLSTGVDAIVEVPPERWSIADLYDEDPDVPGRMATRFGGFLAGIDRFDAPFFGISPREAQSMDPQQRLLLEVTWEALENAGIAVDSVFGSNTGVFLGISNNDYLRMLLADPDDIDTYTITGNALSVAAGRLSYVLGAQGPALAIDTACSSSLVAVHLAMQALRGGETDLALAGGVSLILGPEMTINFSRARMLAADGHCKTFDAAADGYVRSEGCAMIALKRLGDAEADGDRILGVIRGSAVTQDGRSGGLTAPNGPSQEKVLTAALVGAGVDPLAVSYVEAHGTGTPLGDPIEVGALGAVLCRGRAADQPLLLGSVKTNLGHMEAAAGVGGLIKVLLMLEHATIAPHLHLTELHPYIAAEQLPIAVPTEATPWATSGPRIAGVSSFGLSGTNAHLVVEQAPARAAGSAPAADGAVHVLALSAKTPAALDAVAERYVAHLAAHPEQSLADVAATAATGRSHFDHRLAVVARDTSTALTRLRGHLAGAAAHAVVATAGRASSSEVVFLFSGHGAHDAGAGHVLYAEQPVFRAAIDRCGELLAGELDEPLTAVLFDADHDLLDSMRYAQPALFSLQYALAELWQSWGVRASVVAGHSAGEYVAAVVAGVLDLADGLRIISARGRLMHSLPAGGEMVAIFATEADVAAAVERCGGPVGIAAVNGPTTTVISGRSDAVAAVLADLALDDDDFRRLPISVAAHSPLVDPILDEFEAVVASVRLGRPQIGLVSSMTGELVDEEITRPDYWRRHLRQPVRFADVFATLRAAGCSTFVEIGPRSTLLSLGQRCWPDDSATWAASLRPDGDEAEQIATSLASVHVAGAPVDWRAFDQSSARRRRLALPSYPWQRESYWSPAAQSRGRQRATPVWPAVVTAAERQAQHGPLDLQLDRYEARWSILDRLAVAYIGAAVRDLGLFRAAGERIVVRELIAAGRVPPTYVHLVERWLGHLVDDGALRRDGDGFVSIRALPPPDIAALVGEAHIAFVGAEPLLDYVSRCGERLAAVISGEENALATLFPDGSYETVDYLYNQWPVPRYFNAILGAAATAAADARPGRPVRVLEIGAGTGGTSASVLPALPADRTAYVFTDVSDFFLARAAERFAAFPFVRYARFDIERPPADQ
ncbi:MAG: hypothetical protein JWM12_1705, partial [Ilumatobacteraceae bacterium]|nr:hypothetical protein [Ilumatobacteraceae bacterium]